jgi:hypothetical protein
MQEDTEKDMTVIAEAAVYNEMRSHGNKLVASMEEYTRERLDKTG